ncbi:MAG: xanthine dehydrogenase family protein subunit M [Gemmataceae bacterium]|nr:xanthine dehydrogenase family protein subunit M [Gemmataceae bacterium]
MKDIDYAAPKTLAEAVALLDGKGDRARVLAGGTDLIVQVREGRRDIDVMVDVKRIPDLTRLTVDANGLRIGAATPCCDIYEHPEVKKSYPGLVDAAFLIGGIQIQSRASLGGNLCNSSPAGDAIPALIALGAVCVIAGPKGERELPVESFCVSPGRNALARGELLAAIKISAPRTGSGAAYLRFIPRNEMDIAVVGVGVSVVLDAAKSKVVAARIGLGAVAPTPLLVKDAADALVGTTADDAAVENAASLAQAAAKPISDMRGDADYRKHLVAVLVKRTLAIALERARKS